MAEIQRIFLTRTVEFLIALVQCSLKIHETNINFHVRSEVRKLVFPLNNAVQSITLKISSGFGLDGVPQFNQIVI